MCQPIRIALAALATFCFCLLVLGCGSGEAFEGGVRLPESTAEGASWSPHGEWIAIPNKEGVLLRDVVDAGRKQLQAPPMRRHQGAMPGRFGWSSDAGEVHYVTKIGPAENRGGWITVVPTDGGEVRQVPLGTSVQATAWSPAGWPLVYSTGPYAISGGGPIGPKSALWTVDGLDSPPRLLLNLRGEEAGPEFSPDGKRLAFALRSNKGVLGLWVARRNGSHPRRIAGPLIDIGYRWSPDGRQIAMITTTLRGDRRQHLYVVPSNGGRLRELSDEEVDGEPAWTPDGRWITYATYEGTIKRIRPDGSGARTIAGFDHKHVRDLLWSPDGRYLSFSAEEIIESD
jgi:Tol biopolymer transport system component